MTERDLAGTQLVVAVTGGIAAFKSAALVSGLVQSGAEVTRVKARFDLAARPLLPQHDRATLVVSCEVERVLPDIDADHGNCAVEFL